MRSLNSDGPLHDHKGLVYLPEKPHAEDVVAALRKILTKPYIQSIFIPKTGPVEVEWQGPPGDTLDFDLPGPSAARKLRSIEMLSCEYEGTPYELLGAATLLIERTGLVVSHAVVGARTLLWKWVGLDLTTVDAVVPRRIMGGLITSDDELDESTLVLLGSSSQVGALSDVSLGVKVFMEVPRV